MTQLGPLSMCTILTKLIQIETWPFAAAAATIAATVRAAAVVVLSDETSARVEGKTHWQWVFACATAVAHIIAPSRDRAQSR